MFFIRLKTHFDSAHFLKNYVGKCSNIHGHRWYVEIEIKSEKLIEEGSKKDMVYDFTNVKEAINKIVEEYDHCLIVEKGTLQKRTYESLLMEGFRIVETLSRPTAEHLSYVFFEKIKALGYPVYKVSVYETETNCAVYQEDD